MESQIATIFIGIVVQFYLWYLFQDLLLGSACIRFVAVNHEVMIRYIFWKSIRYNDIAVPVIIKVRNQRSPAPVGLRYAAHKAYLAEGGNSNGIIFPHPGSPVEL